MAEEKKQPGSDNLQKSLTKDLVALQARLEKYEDLAFTALEAESAKAWAQVDYYRHETSKVRAAVLAWNTVALKEASGG
jgi:hypothetical protein